MTGSVTRKRRRWIAVAAIVLIGAPAAIVASAWVVPPAANAEGALCRSVAAERGLTFRGAYGTTPFASNPMAAMMLRNMGNGAAVATSTSS